MGWSRLVGAVLGLLSLGACQVFRSDWVRGKPVWVVEWEPDVRPPAAPAEAFLLGDVTWTDIGGGLFVRVPVVAWETGPVVAFQGRIRQAWQPSTDEASALRAEGYEAGGFFEQAGARVRYEVSRESIPEIRVWTEPPRAVSGKGVIVEVVFAMFVEGGVDTTIRLSWEPDSHGRLGFVRSDGTVVGQGFGGRLRVTRRW